MESVIQSKWFLQVRQGKFLDINGYAHVGNDIAVSLVEDANQPKLFTLLLDPRIDERIRGQLEYLLAQHLVETHNGSLGSRPAPKPEEPTAGLFQIGHRADVSATPPKPPRTEKQRAHYEKLKAAATAARERKKSLTEEEEHLEGEFFR